MKYYNTNHQMIFIFVLTLFLSLLQFIPKVSAENDPWWTQGYTADTEIITTYSYNENGARSSERNLGEATITFFDKKNWTESDLSAEEQSILSIIRTTKDANPVSENATLIDEVKKQLPDADVDMIENMIGFYEYETVTGEFAYLNETPSPFAVEMHDMWFQLFADTYPTAPKTIIELEKIESVVYTELAKHFKRTPTHIKNTLQKIEKYQEKHNIPKNVPLSEGMKMAR